MILGFVSCKDNETVSPKPIEKTFPVTPQVTAMNVEIAGRPFNIELRKDGWTGTDGSSWVAKAGIPSYIKFYNTLQKGERENGIYKDIVFNIAAPGLPIIDPEDITFKFEKTYNYAAMLSLFKKGKYKVHVPKIGEQEGDIPNGFSLFLSHVNINDATDSFGYTTHLGSQEGSKWDIVKVEEVYGSGFYVTYDIDCNIYTNKNDKLIKERFVGTIQCLYRYFPF